MQFIRNILQANSSATLSIVKPIKFLGVLLCVFVCTVVVSSVFVQSADAKRNPNIPQKYPRTANYFLDPEISDAEAEELSQWDIVILGVETSYTSPNAFTIMRENNPDIIILSYVASEEVQVKHLSNTDRRDPLYQLFNRLNSRGHWFLKDADGNYLNFYPGSRMINVTTRWKKALPDFVTKKVLKKYPKKWDGVFYDNCFNDVAWVDDNIDVNRDGEADFWKTADAQWKDGMRSIMKRTRKKNPNSIIVCNSNGDYYTYINGRMIEAFPSEFDGGWPGAMQQYFDVLDEGREPRAVIVNTVANSTDASNYQLMRYNLTSTLLGNGFASFDQSIDAHASLWWYDEYSVSLGNPLSTAFNTATNAGPDDTVEAGVWRRNFQDGIVLLNSGSSDATVVLEDGFEKILGTQDTEVNNGRVTGKVTIPARDGIVLLGRLDQVTDAPFLNGSFAKVFNSEGDQPRNTFFTYNSLYGGSNRIVYLEDVNTTVVADDTYVTVYKNDSQIARFAPYGTSFTGGVNIDVDRLSGPNKGYSIVTGTQQYGPHVRIYSLRGELKHPGCFPYAEDFRGGVNVAIGDVLSSNAGQEIVVAVASGGGPHIRILNRNCELISPGFFAYDQNLHSGVSVAVGDVDDDGDDEIVTIPGKGGAPYLRMFTGKGNEVTPGFYAFGQGDRSGAAVAVSDVDDNGTNEIVAMSFSIFNQ